ATPRRAMLVYFREVAAERMIPIEDPPAGFLGTQEPDDQSAAGLPELLAKLDRQSVQIGELTDAINALVGALGPLLVTDGRSLSDRVAELETRLSLRAPAAAPKRPGRITRRPTGG